MDYKKKSLKNLNRSESYEEIDTRLASGWYVDSPSDKKKKKYKTNSVTFKISKKPDWFFNRFYIFYSLIRKRLIYFFTNNFQAIARNFLIN